MCEARQRGVRSTFLPLRANKRAVSAVTGTMLMVATTVGMGASLYFMVWGLLPSTGTEPTFLLLTNRGYHNAAGSGYCCLNDSVLEVTLLRGTRQSWEGAISFEIVSADGSQMLLQGDLVAVPADQALLYVGVYHGSPDEVSVINIGYVDADANGYASAPDFIDLRGMSKEYHIAKILLTTHAGQIGSATIP